MLPRLGAAARALLAVAMSAVPFAACALDDSRPAAPSLGPARGTSVVPDASVVDATPLTNAGDGATDGAPPPYACDAGLLGAIDLAHVALTSGGATPATWSVGAASSLYGPQHDHRFVPDRAFLATHPGALYAPNEDGSVEMDGPDLRALPVGCHATLHAWVWYEIEDLRDGANVLVVPGGGGAAAPVGVAQGPSLYDTDDFSDLECSASCLVRGQPAWSSFAPGSTSWRQATFDVTAFSGAPGGKTRLRFQFHSDHFGEYQGIYVDDVTLTSP